MTTFVFHLSFISLCFLLAGCGGSFKEMQNPIQKQERVSLIEQFGFKTGYNFRQTQIDVDEEARKAGMSLDIIDEQARILQLVVRTKIMPTILELERRKLTNGFYFIMHEKLDLRLSCDSWEEKEQDIKLVLADNGISSELTHYSGLISDDFENLDGNNLEMNSRFVLAYLSIWDRASQEDRIQMAKAVPHRWIHYLYNQFGYLNLVEGISKFESAFFQVEQGYKHGQCDKEYFIQVIERVRDRAEAKLHELKGNYWRPET